MLMDPAALPAPTPPSSGEPRGPPGATPRPSSSSSQLNHPKAQGITHPGGRCQLSVLPLLHSAPSSPALEWHQMQSHFPKINCGKRVLYLPPLPKQSLAGPSRGSCNAEAAQQRKSWIWDPGYGLLGAQGASLSRAGQGLGNSPTASPRFTSWENTTGSTRSIPPLSNKGKNKNSGGVGKRIASTSFRSAAPSWLRFAR